MARVVARLRPVWSRAMVALLLLLVVEVAVVLLDAPVEGILTRADWGPPALAVALVVLWVLVGVAPRSHVDDPVTLAPPVRGEWVAVNSPGQKLPSHGTRTRGQYSAVDVCGRAAAGGPPLVRWGLRGTAPARYPGYDEPVLAMAAGEVVRVLDRQRDHRARDTWQALILMVALEGLLRELGGTRKVLGNHVVVAHDDGTAAVYAHLRRGSAAVRTGQRVADGEPLGRVGNTGNTSLPHLHVQLMDHVHVDAAAGIPLAWSDVEPTGEIDERFASYAKPPADSALPTMPRNGEVFVAG
ncbi:M23 family metallopeptidase [Nocardioides sp. CPCC 205120]|uniref:M23 family metallopeptidase n=1 Tax=Nocardioides sp. CPCC 205120 TaxID=3406462 RepID=UPI003B50A31C